MRAARRAAEAGPRFPAAHWLVLQTLAACACGGVAIETALHGTSGLVAGALVGVVATALCLAGVVVGDVTELRSGMYAAGRELAPAFAQLRRMLIELGAADW